MPSTNLSPGATTFHSGIYPDILVRPNVRPDHTWISQWKFDDISSGSGLDSQGTNNLKGSGSPTQVTGYRQASGVQFDGVDDCFYLDWFDGSGLQNVIRTSIDNSENFTYDASQRPSFGFMCSLMVEDFSKEQILLSKWEEVTDTHWMVGINPSGGIFVQWRNTSNALQSMNSHRQDLFPSGEWVDFAFCRMGNNNTGGTEGPGYAILLNDVIIAETHNSNGRLDPDGGSGVFCVGSASLNAGPSGFFKGRMEDLRWFNGSFVGVPEFNAFKSGVAPLASYPDVNDFNPYIGAHFQMNDLPSGVVGHLDTVYIEERKHGNHVFGSGTQFNHVTHQLRPGACDGTKGSGVAGIRSTGQSYFSRNAAQIKPNTLSPKGSFTIMGWLRLDFATTVDDPTYMGYRMLNNPVGPFNLQINNMTPRIYTGFEHNDRPSFTGSNALASGMWMHFAAMANLEQRRLDMFVSGIRQETDGFDTSGMWFETVPTGAADGYFRMFWTPTNSTAEALSGILDEWIILNYYLPSGEYLEFLNSQSGFIDPANVESGMQGSYVFGQETQMGSGTLGGYMNTAVEQSGIIGGYISGVPPEASGMAGGYVLVGPTQSGMAGGYVQGFTSGQFTIGSYLYGQGTAGLFQGGYTVGVEPVDQEASFVAFYNIIGRNKDEFDAQVKLYKEINAEFDAQVVLFRKELKPGVEMVAPLTAQSGNTLPVSYTFEAQASGLQDKSIYRTFWFFSDDTSTSGSLVTSSGTYQTEHTFTQSGLFDVIFVAMDDKGLINSVRTQINTASGTALPNITLNATPESGVTPLSVAFSGVVNSAPNPIVDDYIYFGDGTKSSSTDSIYKLYPVIGCYIPVYRVRDNQSLIATDSIVLGGNN